jgi:starch phosphorylase
MNALRHSDYYMVTVDFDAYFATQRSVERLWLSKFDWTRMSMLSIARMAWFSSDRTIGEYAQNIWKVPFELPSNVLGREQEQES